MNKTVISYFDVDNIKDAEMHLAWPCRLYKILVPVKKQTNVDIFEKVILQLVNERIDDIDALHKMTGLPINFIKLIVQRLQSLGLLEKKLKLTDKGKEVIVSIEVIQSQNEWEVFSILVENQTGEVLDIISNDSVNKPVFISEENLSGLKIDLGTSGKSIKLFLKFINSSLSNKDRDFNIIEIRSIFANVQKRLLVCQNYDFMEDFSLSSLHHSFDKVELSEEPINVCLHCAVYFNESNNFIYVEDGLGYSQKLTNILPKNIKEQIKRKLIIQNKEGTNFDKKIDKNNIIAHNIKNINDLFNEIKKYDSENPNHNKNKKYYSNQNELIKLLYDTIEHGFAYVHRTRAFEEWKSYIKDNYEINYSQIRNILVDKLNLKETKNFDLMIKQLSKVTYGQVNSLLFGNVTLMPLLVKAIYASQILENYPLLVLLKLQPNLFDDLYRLHQLRNKITHGDKAKLLPKEIIVHIYQNSMEIVRILYPKLALYQQNFTQYTDRELSQKYLKAEIRFAHHFQDNIPELVRDNLFHLFGLTYFEKTINKKSYEVVTHVERVKYIRYLSSSVEKSLLFQIEYLMSMSNQIPSYGEYEFLEWLKEKNITTPTALERKIAKLNPRKIKTMYEKINTLALLDLFIFYLFLSMNFSDLSLNLIINQNIDLSEIIVKIHQFRGHGNGLTDEFYQATDEQIIALQKSAFLIIQVLTQSY